MNSNELKAARIKRGISSKDLAGKLNWSAVKYSVKENGSRPMSLTDAKKISAALNLSPAEILLIFFDININSNDKLPIVCITTRSETQ